MRALLFSLIVFLNIPAIFNRQSKHFLEGSFSPTLSYRLLDDNNGVDQTHQFGYEEGWK